MENPIFVRKFTVRLSDNHPADGCRISVRQMALQLVVSAGWLPDGFPQKSTQNVQKSPSAGQYSGFLFKNSPSAGQKPKFLTPKNSQKCHFLQSAGWFWPFLQNFINFYSLSLHIVKITKKFAACGA